MEHNSKVIFTAVSFRLNPVVFHEPVSNVVPFTPKLISNVEYICI